MPGPPARQPRWGGVPRGLPRGISESSRRGWDPAASAKKLVRILAIAVVVAAGRPAAAYSVLAHEANIDALWDSAIRPLLLRRFPATTREQMLDARAYAYGGSVIQDLGYYPFGSRFFSNLLHYVRSGDFVETMLRDAKNVDEYAFALGAMAHYAADNTGHPEAVNRSVALMYPKLRAKYGDSITYAQARAQHVIVELSFDIVQVAAGAYVPDSYHRFIGFQVAKPVLERAFHDTYGLELPDVFADEDLAIGTYRRAVSEILPELTRAAWRDKKDEIARLVPGVTEERFVYRYTRQQFEKDFGANYRKPGLFARFLGFIYRVLPKIGPLQPLSFKAPTPEAEKLFTESLADTRARYAAALNAAAAGRLNLANTDFDTGRPSAQGEYPLADKTYAQLLDKLKDRKFESVPAALRANIKSFYSRGTPPKNVQRHLAALSSAGH
ncbi:MAG TPA: zinc dependent phospholipase C family protein [Vicinamibacterales bacterium]|nr:zinc dependent phospholipase C family protein [Vicinamibacterales bacterium]